MKTYHGFIRHGEPNVAIVNAIPVCDGRGSILEHGNVLPLRLEFVNHSPCGFSWGYAGSGPMQLSFSILYDVTGCPRTSQLHYGQFCRLFVVPLDWDDQSDGFKWAITEEDVRGFVASIGQPKRKYRVMRAGAFNQQTLSFDDDVEVASVEWTDWERDFKARRLPRPLYLTEVEETSILFTPTPAYRLPF